MYRAQSTISRRGGICVRSRLCHSRMKSAAFIRMSRNGNRKPCAPFGVSSEANVIPAMNRAHVRTVLGSSTTASTATRAARTRPAMKLPCRLAHSTISGTMAAGGALASDLAIISQAVQISITGKASRCGRASRDGATVPAASKVRSKAGARSRNLPRWWSIRAAARAAAPANSMTTPAQPAPRNTRAIASSASHSWAVQGRPRIV